MTTTPTDPVIEMLIGGLYVDITPDCRLVSADSGGGFEVTRGRPNEGSKAEPTQLNFVLNNGMSKVAGTLGQSGVYSPRNPLSPYFGLIGRNQKVRLGLNRVTDDFSRVKLPNSQAIDDGTFETGVTGWIPANGTFVRSTAQHHNGVASGLLTTVGAPTQTLVRGTQVPVIVGQSYRVSAWLLSVAGAPNVDLSIDWLTAGGAFISNSGGTFTLSAGVWTARSMSGTAPATAAFAQYGPTLASSPPAGRAVFIDDVDFCLAGNAGWGKVPDRLAADGVTLVPGKQWNLFGVNTNFGMPGDDTATIQSVSGYQIASLGTYADVDIKARMKTSVRDTEFGIALRHKTDNIGGTTGLDGSFETGTGGWVASGTNVLSVSTAQHHSGSQSAQVTVAGSPASVSLIPDPAHAIRIKAGNTYRCKFWMRTSIAASVNAILSFYDANLTFVGSTTATVAHTAGVWTYNTVTVAAPENAQFARPGFQVTGSPANGTLLFMDDWELYTHSDQAWYSTTLLPGTPDIVKLNKISGHTVEPNIAPTDRSITATSPIANVVVGTYYWMRAQMTSQRLRIKFWLDGTPEPTFWYFRYFDDTTVGETPVGLTGEVGLIVKDGTSLVTFDHIEINQWRAHAEIAELPPRWDISRSDRWVPVQARGILRRLGQGRKALQSAVTLYLNSFLPASSGWWTLEADSGDTAGNQVVAGQAGVISGLSFSQPDLSGALAIPGISGFATLDQDTSFFISSVPKHTNPGIETVLFFMKYPNAAVADTLLGTITTTGTARTWKIWATVGGGMRVDGIGSDGTVLGTSTVLMYFLPDHPQGCWLACTLLLKNNAGNIDWALNFHKPGNTTFYSCNGSFAGVIGNTNNVIFRGSPALSAMGNISITQVMHYAGDLPFVTFDFRRAAYAYIGETAGARWIRLGTNANIQVSTLGLSSTTEVMGAQLPSKTLDLLEECATVDDGIMTEARDDWELTMVTRDSLWNRYARTMDIDAGHLSAPLEPTDDDQGTRNDVTVSRPNGGFARSTVITGPLNVNPPETDPQGVGIYDDAPDVNFGTDQQLLPAAHFRTSKGTQDEARYPSMHADLAASAYQASGVLAAVIMGIDSGDVIGMINPEVSADPHEQQVQAYTEKIDQFDWDLVFTATPSSVYRVGVVNYTTRIGSESNVTQAAFQSGTDTRMLSTLVNPLGYQWTTLLNGDASFPFDIDVSGVRLRCRMVGDVLNGNPSFTAALGLTGWVVTSVNVTLALDEFDPIRGVQSARVNAVAAGTDGIVQDPTASAITVAATDYLISGWIKTEAAATALRLGVDWYQANNTTFISTTLGTPITTVAGTWTNFQAVVTSPALGARGRLKVTNVFAGATRMYMQDLRLIPVSSYTADPQTLTVDQVPVNGIIKAIPIGSVIRLAAPWRVGW